MPKRRAILRTISRTDLDALLEVAKEPFRTMMMLQWAAGLRPGEACKLRAGDMDVASGEFIVPRDGKTGERPMRFDPDGRAGEAMRAWAERRSAGDYFFGGPAAVIEDTYYRAVVRYCDKAGLPRMKPYIFRHTFATDMMNRGVALADIAAMMGNSPQTCARSYLHPDPDMIQAAVRGR